MNGRHILVATVIAVASGCTSADKLAEQHCAYLGTYGSPGFSDCVMRDIDNILAERSARSANTAAWLGVAAQGAQMMQQARPQPQVTTTNCMAYGNNATCTSVTH
jgi:hypothetical protein